MHASKQVLIVANPKSGSSSRSDLVTELQSQLHDSGFEARVFYDLAEFERQLTQIEPSDRLRAVVAAGGDGTASAVVSRVRKEVPIALFPLGTENLLARQLGATADPIATTRSIEQMVVRQMDAGLANDKLFLVMVGVGFDAEVVRQVHTTRRGHIQRLTYAVPILRSITNYAYPELRVRVFGMAPSIPDCSEIQQRETVLQKSWTARWLFVANVSRYAGGLSIAHDADETDGLLDVCTFRRGGLLTSLIYLVRLWMNNHQKLRDFQSVQACRIEVTSDGHASYQVDGDFGGDLPLHIEVLPGRFRAILPALPKDDVP